MLKTSLIELKGFLGGDNFRNEIVLYSINVRL